MCAALPEELLSNRPVLTYQVPFYTTNKLVAYTILACTHACMPVWCMQLLNTYDASSVAVTSRHKNDMHHTVLGSST